MRRQKLFKTVLLLITLTFAPASWADESRNDTLVGFMALLSAQWEGEGLFRERASPNRWERTPFELEVLVTESEIENRWDVQSEMVYNPVFGPDYRRTHAFQYWVSGNQLYLVGNGIIRAHIEESTMTRLRYMIARTQAGVLEEYVYDYDLSTNGSLSGISQYFINGRLFQDETFTVTVQP